MKRLVLENRNSIVHQIREYLENNSEAKYIHRLQVILLFADSEDKSCDTLGALFGNSPRSISNWISGWVKNTSRMKNRKSLTKCGEIISDKWHLSSYLEKWLIRHNDNILIFYLLRITLKINHILCGLKKFRAKKISLGIIIYCNCPLTGVSLNEKL